MSVNALRVIVCLWTGEVETVAGIGKKPERSGRDVESETPERELEVPRRCRQQAMYMRQIFMSQTFL